MTDAAAGLARRAAELRSAFDLSFAAPLRVDGATIKQDLLAIKVGTEPFAVRLAEVAGLFADRTITRIPGSKAALLGLAGFRGTLVPVYSLRLLLLPLRAEAGNVAGPSGVAPHWILLVAGAPVALAFDAFEGHLRASSEAILAPQPPRHDSAHAGQGYADARGYAPELIRAGAVVRPVIHLAAVVAALSATDEREALSKAE